MVVHSPVFGFHSSAWRIAPAWLLNPGALVPPVTSTLPSAKMVAFICRRGNAMLPVLRQAGAAWVRSMTSADAVGALTYCGAPLPPPAYRILPGAYITADPSTRSATTRGPTVVHCPVPLTSR